MTPPPLPLEEKIPEIISHVKNHPFTLVKAEPGAGKTTKLPPALMELGATIVLEPRRLAAKLAAQFVASSINSSCGDIVGYQVRFDQKVSESTKLRFVTEGLFLRLLQGDPHLSSYKIIILDEFHERHLATDICLAYLRHLQQSSRPDLRIVIMSATIDTNALQSYLGLNHSFSIAGKVFPVRIQYQPLADQNCRLEERVLNGIRDIEKSKQNHGNILVFLSGIQEIESCLKFLKQALNSQKYLILALYSDLSPGQQKKVFESSAQRKIILSTNVAETSLTIEGIVGVIDAGQAKVSGFAYWSGLPTLQLQKISQASCIQRSGRAGRLGPGLCIRLFDEHDYLKRPAFSKPDMERSDLSEFVLISKELWGDKRKIASIPWLSPPPAKHLDMALETLKILGAMDHMEHLTPKGKDMTKIPLHPRLASMLWQGRRLKLSKEACLLVAIISEDFILDHSFTATETGECDLCFQGRIFLKWCHNEDQESIAIERALQVKKLPQVLRLFRSLCPIMGEKTQTEGISLDPRKMRPIILAGFPDRVAKYRPGARNKKNPQMRSYNFCMGRGGILSKSSQVRNHDYVIALKAYEDPSKFNAALKTSISVVSSIKEEQLKTQPHFFSMSQEFNYDYSKNMAYSHHKEHYGKLLLSEDLRKLEPAEFKALVHEKMAREWPFPFTDSLALDILINKIKLLDEVRCPHKIPDFKAEFFDYLLDHILEGHHSIEEILKRQLHDYLFDLIEYEDQELLKKLTPDSISLGSRPIKIHYLGDHAPYVSAGVQDFFGLADTPTICEGRIKLSCILLAPNRRPAQVTQNLAGFWKGSYQEVRKELSRRYPKHHWPLDPQSGS